MHSWKSNTHPPSHSRGSLLLELLVAISILAIILTIASQAIFVSLQSQKVSSERDVALALASETLEAVRAVADEKWANIYGLTKTTQAYYPLASGNKWTLVAGSEVVSLNNASYTRSVIIENVNRCLNVEAGGGRSLASSTVGCSPSTNYANDPSAQKVTVTVSWSGGNPIVINEYFFRWRNKACSQTNWAGLNESGSTVLTCGTTRFDVMDAGVSTSTGTIRLIP